MRTDKWFRTDYQEMIDDWLVDLRPGARLAWLYLVGYVRESSTSQKRPNVASALSPRSASRIWVIDADDITDMIAAAVQAGHLIFDAGMWIVTDATRFVSERTLQRMAASAGDLPGYPADAEPDDFDGADGQTTGLSFEPPRATPGDAPGVVCRQTDDLSANAATVARETKDNRQLTTTPNAGANGDDPPEPPPGPWWHHCDRPLLRTTMEVIRACPVWAKVPEIDLPDEAFLLRIFGEFARRPDVTDETLDFEIHNFGEYYRQHRPSFNAPAAGVKLADWLRRAGTQQRAPAKTVRPARSTAADIAEQARARTREALAAAGSDPARKGTEW